MPGSHEPIKRRLTAKHKTATCATTLARALSELRRWRFSQPDDDDQELGFFANFLGIFIFVLVIAYVVADPKFDGN